MEQRPSQHSKFPPIVAARDSFARINDYLCEELLMYLPPDQKLKFAGVSAQFERTIFRRQRQLTIAPTNNEWNKVKNQILKRFVGDFSVKHKVDAEMFDELLSKFCHVDDIVILYNLDTANMDELIASIIRHCHKVRRFQANFFNISEKMLDEFGRCFGHSLRVVKSSYVSPSNTKIPNSFALLKHCSNLVSLKSSGLLSDQLLEPKDESTSTTSTTAHADIGTQTMLPKLRSCHLNVTNVEGVNELENFSSVYMNHVEKIKVDMVDYIYRSHYMVNFIFPMGICKFRNLRQCLLTLKYNGGYDADFVWLNNGLTGIANDCPKLAHLGIDFIGHQDFFINHVLQSLTSFEHLPRLSISVSMYNKGLEFPQMLSVRQLDLAYPRLYQCTHLKQLVHAYPQVSILKLNWMYFFNDVLLNSLIGLRRLQRLKVGGLCPPDVTTNGLCTFLNASAQIQSIAFDKTPKINVKTFDMLIDFVNRKPEVYYDFDFCLRDAEAKLEFDQMLSSLHLPNNISIQ